MRDSPFTDRQARAIAGRMGLRIFLISLGVLFIATLIAFASVRMFLAERNAWPADLPPLPNLLWLSTAVLAMSSVSMQWAVNGIRAGHQRRLRAGLLITALLGVGFLLVQSRCWLEWMVPVSQRWDESDEHRFALTSFYVLTGIHALHVIGGLIPMTVTARRAFDGRYSPDEHAAVQYVAAYWHFLGVVWIVLYLTMWLGR